MAATTTGPMVRFGTKRPSITSTWSWSASASTRAISSPSAAKSADRIDGAIFMAPSLYHPAQAHRGEAVRAVAIRPAAQESVGVGRERKVGRWIDREVAVPGEEAGHDLIVLLGLQRARCVHETSARPHHPGRGGEDLPLTAGARGDVAGLAAPLDLGVAS